MLPDVPTSAIAVDPLHPDHIYVGNDIGVFVSTDGGGSWFSFQEGLPEAAIAMDLSISLANRRLRVATHGNGVYERPLLEPTGADSKPPVIPASYQLLQNHPNPFNASTNISFRLPKGGVVNLSVYNVAGQLVETLTDGYRDVGLHTVEWNAQEVSSGVYFYRLTVGNHRSVKKCVLIR